MTRPALILHFAIIFVATHMGRVTYAQAKKDSTAAADTVRNRFVPTGVRVGTDIVSLAKTRFQDNFNGWEMQADMDFNRYILVVEYGHSGRNFNSPTASYSNSGNFWRTGVDINFLQKDPDRNVFFLGARYGKSVFRETMSLSVEDPLWGTLSETFHHAGLNASWLELTAGLKVRIWQIFWLGYTARLKFGLSVDNTPEMLPYDVPGFGRTDKETTWGFNYYLMIRLPLRKAPPVAPQKK